MAATPCKVGATDIACEAELMATPSLPMASLRPGPAYIVRAVGPTIEVCEIQPMGQAGSTFVSKIVCRVRAGGLYELRPLLMYESESEAFPAPPDCSTPCVCSDLELPGKGFADFAAPHARLAFLPGRWRWTRESAGGWEWASDSGTEPGRSKSLPSPGTCPRIHLVGDSHDRAAYDLLRANGFDVTYIGGIGVQQHWMLDMERIHLEATRGDCRRQAFRGGEGPGSLLRAAQDLPKLIPGLSKGDVVVLSAGSWDLRDMSVEHFARDLELLFSRAARYAGFVRLVFRLAPAYSYLRDDFLRGREMRTNQKLMAARDAVRRSLPAAMALWDSFAVTLPRFEESCDTHHFICAGKDLDKSRIGIADVSHFLGSVCDNRTAVAVKLGPQRGNGYV